MTHRLGRLLLPLLALLPACRTLPPPDRVEVPRTAGKLAALHGPAPSAAVRAEASQLAETAHTEAAEAARRFRVDTPAWMHNLLVNVRLKPGGLCWQYMDCLHARLAARRPRHFQLHYGVQARSDVFLEHNCVVVTAPGAPFSSGLVLDPWKSPGALLVHPVSEGPRPWHERLDYPPPGR